MGLLLISFLNPMKDQAKQRQYRFSKRLLYAWSILLLSLSVLFIAGKVERLTFGLLTASSALGIYVSLVNMKASRSPE
jgi:hypothetical protein